MADTRDIEASRPEFEAQMRASGYRDDRHDTGEYVGVTSNRWEGWIAALASRPAEVDDKGLPPLPPSDPDLVKRFGPPTYTAEQYRQGQRDAVAADRARRQKGGA